MSTKDEKQSVADSAPTLEKDAMDEMYKNMVLETVMDNLERVFMLNQNHPNEEIGLEMCENLIVLTTQSEVKYSADNRIMTSKEWERLKDWLNKCKEKDVEALIPRAQIQHDNEDIADESELLSDDVEMSKTDEMEERKDVTKESNDVTIESDDKREVKITRESATSEPLETKRDESDGKMRETKEKQREEYGLAITNVITQMSDVVATTLLTIRKVENRQKDVVEHIKLMENRQKEILSRQEKTAEELRTVRRKLDELTTETAEIGNGDEFDRANEKVNNENNFRNEILDLVRQEISDLGLNKQTAQVKERSVNVNDVKEAIKFEIISTENNMRRDYKLLVESKYEHFYDYLPSELRANELLYVIDLNVKPSREFDESTIEKHKFKVRDILINRLDQRYHSKVVYLKDPVQILGKIKELKECETNLTNVVIRQQLYNLKFNTDKESALDFCKKLEEEIRSY